MSSWPYKSFLFVSSRFRLCQVKNGETQYQWKRQTGHVWCWKTKDQEQEWEGDIRVWNQADRVHTNKNHTKYNWKDLVQAEEDKDRDSDIEIIEIEGPPKKKLKKSHDPEDEYDLDDDFIDDTE